MCRVESRLHAATYTTEHVPLEEREKSVFLRNEATDPERFLPDGRRPESTASARDVINLCEEFAHTGTGKTTLPQRSHFNMGIHSNTSFVCTNGSMVPTET